MNASVPIEANGIIPVSQSDVAGIPPIALTIPDFEGQAILRIFANSTESEIGCYSAVVTNGASFSHPNAVGTVLGLFTAVAVVASFVSAIYGDHIPTTRNHYAHSLSVLVVFSVLHHIFFTGALSMNWPSVLVAFWSNYAWSGGMIYTKSMQNSINQLIGSNKGNTSIVGAAGAGSLNDNIGGGYQLSKIYKRAVFNLFHRDVDQLDQTLKTLRSRDLERALAKRTVANSTTGYSWYGSPVKPGLPLPGNFSGFPGTLAEENIPASNAFITGFLWFLILVVIVASLVVGSKWVMEGLSRFRIIKNDRLAYFRAHWLEFTGIAIARTVLIAFFMMMFLIFFQFTYKGSTGTITLAVIVFMIFSISMFSVVGYACFYRLRFGRYKAGPEKLHLVKRKALGFLPLLNLELESHRHENPDPTISVGSIPWWRVTYVNEDTQRVEIHQDEDYLKKFGWLSARFRRTRWWFFTVWLTYEFIRACFYGGAAGRPMTQVFGLLVVEVIALITLVVIKPFEGARLNTIMIYMLGFSKVATLALSAAFDTRFNLQRISTTVVGVVIIVIQSLLTIALMIGIVLGAISSYMSVTRNREEFRPLKWAPYRQKYFAHIEKAVADLPPPPPPVPEEPKEPYFSVASVRRCPKIEDDDDDDGFKGPRSSRQSVFGLTKNRDSRADSMQSQISLNNVPFGARVHRASWSSRDFSSWNEASNRSSRQLASQSSMLKTASGSSLNEYPRPTRVYTPVRSTTPLEMGNSRHGKEKDTVSGERGDGEWRG